MRKLFLGAVLAALCAVPTMSRAETPWSVAAPTQRDTQARPAWNGVERRADDDYATREKASPQLAQFAGGAEGIYIGAGALVAALIIVLLIAAL